MSKKNRRTSQIILDRKLDYTDLISRFGRRWWCIFSLYSDYLRLALQPPEGVPLWAGYRPFAAPWPREEISSPLPSASPT